jgi:hypothetical protein
MGVWVEPVDLEVGQVYDVDMNGDVRGEFSSRLIAKVPDGDGYFGHLEFENGVTLDLDSDCRYWKVDE